MSEEIGVSEGVFFGTFVTAINALGATEAIGIPAFIVLLALKLGLGDTTVEDWSWWGVTAPLWGGAAISAIFFLVAVLSLIISVAKRV